MIRPVPTLFGVVAGLVAACGDYDPPPSYCEPCAGEVPIECEEICSPDDGPESWEDGEGGAPG